MAEDKWTVEYYCNAKGRYPAVEFIKSLSRREQAVLLRVVDLLEHFGLTLKYPYVRQIERGLWELRAGAGRLFYFAHTGRRFIILHGYRKKSQKAPTGEINIAKRRWVDFLERRT